MTEKCASQPFRFFSCACTIAASGLLNPEMDSASSTSSECSRGLWWPRYSILVLLMGAMTDAGISSSLWSMPARYFSAFSSSAAEAPSRDDVLPVTTVPSGSVRAPDTVPVSSAFFRLATTAGHCSGDT